MAKIPVNVKLLVPVTSNHGGYKGITCIICDETGWQSGKAGIGLCFGTDAIGMKHALNCPVGACLTVEGAVKDG
jgi:hypothetical protein